MTSTHIDGPGFTEDGRPIVPHDHCPCDCGAHMGCYSYPEQYDGGWRMIHDQIANDLKGFGGLLRCTECGRERPLGSVSIKLASGWPKCCGYTMRWWTQRQLDAEQYNGLERHA